VASTAAPPLLSTTTALPSTEADSPPLTAPPTVTYAAPGAGLPAAEIVLLTERGDAILRTGDITSARLYYERAVEAGDGRAALQLGASFDPLRLVLAGVRGVAGDPAQALSWYRRARELGMPEAEPRINSLETRPLDEADTRSRYGK